MGLFSVPEEFRSDREISRWWMLRRIPYTLLVLGGFISGYIAYLIILDWRVHTLGRSLEDNPFALCCGVFIIPIMANVAYSIGPVSERFARAKLGARARHFGPIAVGVGLACSLLLMFAPALINALYVIVRLSTVGPWADCPPGTVPPQLCFDRFER